MYIHQKTSSIEKNIKNVLQFIHGIEKDVKNMNALNLNSQHEHVPNVHKIVVSEDEVDEDHYDTESESDSDTEHTYEVINDNVIHSNNVEPNNHIMDINTSPLQDLFNIQVVKSNEDNVISHEEHTRENPIEQITKEELNNLTVTDLRRYMRELNLNISSSNIKKMKKIELIEAIFQRTHEPVVENDDNIESANTEHDDNSS